MKRLFPGLALVAVLVAPALAQQPETLSLTAAQSEGQRLFVQHCGLCHNKIHITMPAPNGPAITRAVLDGGKDAQVKAQIANGSPNMPGYKLMFEPEQIDSLVEYIRRLNPPAPRPVPANR